MDRSREKGPAQLCMLGLNLPKPPIESFRLFSLKIRINDLQNSNSSTFIQLSVHLFDK